MPKNGKISAAAAFALCDDLYRRQVRPTMPQEPDGWFLSVDVATGDYELAERHIDAVTRLAARRPAADIHTIVIGKVLIAGCNPSSVGVQAQASSSRFLL